ncbi:hypothetical protein Athai_67470 [Actinocatenispora thailandica]|uniref:Uncharacterized protein n=1 Tax=Actinocatenispora thailandica TaxID=227318 RepID=A0A7R7I163_9ACTN|nr:hypothetical protein [Actinocatenispora thailandica]BCJ39244.1 hypothetical protein Athai_67470 [Actinocatenispora thailandica]
MDSITDTRTAAPAGAPPAAAATSPPTARQPEGPAATSPPTARQPEGPAATSPPTAQQPEGRATAGTPPAAPPAARLAVGLVLLAADRLKITDAVPAPARTALTATLGLADEAAGTVRRGRREAMRTVRSVAGTVDRMANRFADDHQRLTAPARRGATAVRHRLDRARRAGDAAASAGRADAERYVAGRVEDTLAWAGQRALPPLLDMAVPQLVGDIVPRILDGVLPLIRDRLVPTIIDDLADDPAVRDLVREQSRGLVAAAAEQVQNATGSADDRIETGLRRLFGGHR